MAIIDISGHMACNRSGSIDTAAKEGIDVGIVDLPVHITVNLLLAGSCRLLEVTATDIALCIIIPSYIGILVVGSGEIELVERTTRHGDRNMGS